MSREYPDWISPDCAADGKRLFGGTIPLVRFRRLVALLVNAEGEATFSATFSRDVDRRVCIDLQIEAALSLVCQASLEVYQEQVKRRSALLVIASDKELDGLSDHCEVVKSEHGRIAIVELVEDELLLALPQIPRKPGLHNIEYSTKRKAEKKSARKPGQDSASMNAAKQNPFAALQDLLGRDEQDETPSD